MDRSKVSRIQGMRGKAIAIMIAVYMAVMLPTVGYSKKATSFNGIKTVEKDYTKGQIMVVVATERNHYQNIYTSELWSTRVDDSNVTSEDKLINQIRQSLIELATTNMMADEQGVELTGQEKDSLKTSSEEYYHSLSGQDKDYIDVLESEMYGLYCEYYRAGELIEELTRNENLEVSNTEARVIQAQQIELNTRGRVEDTLSQIRQENTDSFFIATRGSKDARILYTMEWNDHLNNRQEAALALEQDKTSGVVEQDGKHRIFKCTNAYDEKATAARKNMLAQDKKTRTFLAICEPLVREHAIKFGDDLREVVNLSGGQGCVTDSFFRLYHSYFIR